METQPVGEELCKSDRLLQMLFHLKEVFDKQHIEFWLDWGTLLGAVREGRIIPGDNDIDLCIWKSDIDKLAGACEELGYYYYYEEDKYLRLYRDDIHIGILLVSLKNGDFSFEYLVPRGILGRVLDYLLWVSQLRNPKFKEGIVPVPISRTLVKIFAVLPFRWNIVQILKIMARKLDSYIIVLSVPKKYFEELKEIVFCGERFKIPKNAEDYLTYKYGDWKTPSKYTYWIDDGSIVEKYRYGKKCPTQHRQVK